MNENEKDFLIISFNEEGADYKEAIMPDLINKIEKTKPKIIFVCTQESRSGGDKHFQHIFGEKLKTEYIRLLKVDGSKTTGIIAGIFLGGNRNCRTRIYYLKNTVVNQSNKKITNTTNTTNKIIITEKEQQLTKNSSLTFARAVFKNAILTKVILKSDKTEYKFAVVNTHLFFTDKGNTFLKKRTEQFFSLVKEFELTKLYEEGFNIFFCGDLNFRLVRKETTILNLKQNNESLQEKILEKQENGIIYLKKNAQNNNQLNPIKKINNKNINNQLNPILKKINNQLNPILKKINNKNINNELYAILNKINHNINNDLNDILNKDNVKIEFKGLLSKFKESLDIIGFPLTCPLKQGRIGTIDFQCMKKIDEQFIGDFQCSKTKKKKGIPKTTSRTPSNCDKILFALYNLRIKKDDLFLPKYPVESDHRLVSLFGKFGREQIEL